MSTVETQLVGDGLIVEATDGHPAGVLWSGGYNSKSSVLYATSVMIVELGNVYQATDSMSLPRALNEMESEEVQAALEKYFGKTVVRVEKLSDIVK